MSENSRNKYPNNFFTEYKAKIIQSNSIFQMIYQTDKIFILHGLGLFCIYCLDMALE